jgi:hypothetical protein
MNERRVEVGEKNAGTKQFAAGLGGITAAQLEEQALTEENNGNLDKANDLMGQARMIREGTAAKAQDKAEHMEILKGRIANQAANVALGHEKVEAGRERTEQTKRRNDIRERAVANTLGGMQKAAFSSHLRAIENSAMTDDDKMKAIDNALKDEEIKMNQKSSTPQRMIFQNGVLVPAPNP